MAAHWFVCYTKMLPKNAAKLHKLYEQFSTSSKSSPGALPKGWYNFNIATSLVANVLAFIRILIKILSKCLRTCGPCLRLCTISYFVSY